MVEFSARRASSASMRRSVVPGRVAMRAVVAIGGNEAYSLWRLETRSWRLEGFWRLEARGSGLENAGAAGEGAAACDEKRVWKVPELSRLGFCTAFCFIGVTGNSNRGVSIRLWRLEIRGWRVEENPVRKIVVRRSECKSGENLRLENCM